MSEYDLLACHLAEALDRIEKLEASLELAQIRMQSAQGEIYHLRQRQNATEKLLDPPEKPEVIRQPPQVFQESKRTYGRYLGSRVRIISEVRGFSEIRLPDGSRTHVESRMVKP